MNNIELSDKKIGVIGLGYVGLPLAVEFSKKFQVVGFDISQDRISELINGYDNTGEVQDERLLSQKKLKFTSDEKDLQQCDVYIVTVPTPIDEANNPDLRPILAASELVAKHLSKDDIVIYESTVYPGCTEEVCVPILEHFSGLKFNFEFYVGYSPERINPGDKLNTLANICKLTSGSTDIAAEFVDKLYASIIHVGTHKCCSIKVAEAAKVIENTQRDVNIALINELSMLFHKMQIDTQAVLAAASTKWNFLPFKPGLVGGHCIGVDPYYLTHKAEAIGFHPQMILAGRRINDGMPKFIAENIIKEMINKNITIHDSKILIMGITFKENCPDLRNSKVFDMIYELMDYGVSVEVFDPVARQEEVERLHNIRVTNDLKVDTYDAVVIAVPHFEFEMLGYEKIQSYGHKKSIFCDLKSIFPDQKSDFTL